MIMRRALQRAFSREPFAAQEHLRRVVPPVVAASGIEETAYEPTEMGRKSVGAALTERTAAHVTARPSIAPVATAVPDRFCVLTASNGVASVVVPAACGASQHGYPFHLRLASPILIAWSWSAASISARPTTAYSESIGPATRSPRPFFDSAACHFKGVVSYPR